MFFQTEFNYSSSYWTNNETYAIEDGLEGLTEKQTKLASYWNTPFDKICLGMKFKEETKWISVDHQNSSLFNAIEDGFFKKTDVGKDAWKSLMDDSLLQPNCNKEGFNLQPEGEYGAYVKARIGLVTNDQNNCTGCDSCIGFGVSVSSCKPNYDRNSTSCGSSRRGCGGNPNWNKAAFGYILVQ